jgi:PAS domain-containing protein
MLACDREGRILSAGRGVFELTGFPEGDLMGKDLREALALVGEDGKDPVGTVLEWGVRQMDQPMSLKSRAGLQKRVRCDFFPAYDEDGGMLASIAPTSNR